MGQASRKRAAKAAEPRTPAAEPDQPPGPATRLDELGVPAFGSIDIGKALQRNGELAMQLEAERLRYESYIGFLRKKLGEQGDGAATASEKRGPSLFDLKQKELTAAYAKIAELEKANADMRSQLGAPPNGHGVQLVPVEQTKGVAS